MCYPGRAEVKLLYKWTETITNTELVAVLVPFGENTVSSHAERSTLNTFRQCTHTSMGCVYRQYSCVQARKRGIFFLVVQFFKKLSSGHFDFFGGKHLNSVARACSTKAGVCLIIDSLSILLINN